MTYKAGVDATFDPLQLADTLEVAPHLLGSLHSVRTTCVSDPEFGSIVLDLAGT